MKQYRQELPHSECSEKHSYHCDVDQEINPHVLSLTVATQQYWLTKGVCGRGCIGQQMDFI